MEYLYHVSPFKFNKLEPKTQELDSYQWRSCASTIEFLNLSYGFPKIHNGFTTTNLARDYISLCYHEGDVEINLKEKSYIYAFDKSHFQERREKYEFICYEPINFEYYLEIHLKDYLDIIKTDRNVLELCLNREKNITKLTDILLILNEINDLLNENNALQKNKQQIFFLINTIIDNYRKFELESYFHDITHSLRVIRNVIYLFNKLGKEENIFEFILAAGYHDCGRSLGFEEKDHPYHSFLLAKRLIPDGYYDMDLIQKLIIFHENEELAKEEDDISIIRDADILDLPRVGIKIDFNRMSYPDIAKHFLTK